jgi:WD40 repeat protein
MSRCLALSVFLPLLLAGGGEPDVDPEPEAIERLVDRLGSDAFAEREDAFRQLREIAELALPALRRRLSDPDAELRLRARALVASIEKNGEVLSCKGHKGEVLAVLLLPGDRQAISAGTDNSIRLWDLKTGREVRSYDGHTRQVWCLALSPDGRQFASGGQDLTVRIWNTETGELVKTLPPLSDPIRCLAFTPDGKALLVGSFGARIQLFDLDKGTLIRSFGEQPGGILSLALSADGKRFLTGGGFHDRTIRLWDVETGQELLKLTGHAERVSGVAFLAGDQAVSAAQDQTIRIWDLKTGQELFRFSGHTGPIHSLAVAPSGTHLLTGAGGTDRTIRVWDLDSRDELRRYTAHEDAVCCLAVMANGKQFVSASSDKTLRLWNMPRIRRAKPTPGG